MTGVFTMTNVKSITFRADGFRLRGILHLPEVDHPPLVIGSHGLLSTCRSPKQIALAESCNAAGIAYFRFDHRGCGDSDGVFHKVTSLKARCDDLRAAVARLQDTESIGRQIGLFGSSYGGAVSISIADALSVDALVTVAAPARSRTINAAAHHRQTGTILDERMLSFDISDRLSRVGRIFVIHGDADEVVPVSDAGEIHENAQAPKRLWIQPGGDHRMSDPDLQREFVKRATDWFKERFTFRK